MKDFQRHYHYDTSKLTLDQKIAIIIKAYKKNYDWWIDKLDCSKSWSRERIGMPFDYIMNLFDDKTYFTIIHRRAYEDPWFGEIGFRTGNDIEYFLWIKISENDLDVLVQEYKLTAL